MAFDLVGDRCVRPCGELRVVERRKGVGHHSSSPNSRIEEAEIARVVDVERPSAQQLGDLVNQLWQRYRIDEVVGGQVGADLGRRHVRSYRQPIELELVPVDSAYQAGQR